MRKTIVGTVIVAAIFVTIITTLALHSEPIKAISAVPTLCGTSVIGAKELVVRNYEYSELWMDYSDISDGPFTESCDDARIRIAEIFEVSAELVTVYESSKDQRNSRIEPLYEIPLRLTGLEQLNFDLKACPKTSVSSYASCVETTLQNDLPNVITQVIFERYGISPISSLE